MRNAWVLVLLLGCSSSSGKSDLAPLDCSIDSGAALDTGKDSGSGPLDVGRSVDACPVDVRAVDVLTASIDVVGNERAALVPETPAIDAAKLDSSIGADMGKDTAPTVDGREGADLESSLDTGEPCGSNQILVNGTCQPCGGVGMHCCAGKCSATQAVCMNDNCFRCGDLGSICCAGNLCAVGTCKTRTCVQ